MLEIHTSQSLSIKAQNALASVSEYTILKTPEILYIVLHYIKLNGHRLIFLNKTFIFYDVSQKV